jgi:adenylate cyclase
VKRIDGLNALELDLMRVKGRAHPTRIYTPADAIALDSAKFGDLDRLHMQFLQLYRKADWDAAEAALAQCENFGIAGLTKLYHLYRERIDEWRRNPPPADWDGTFTATSK